MSSAAPPRRALAPLAAARRLRGQHRPRDQERAPGAGAARRLRQRERGARIRRRGARPLRDRSRLPRRRQDRRRASSMSAIACSAGDVVARLDPQDLKLQVESAEAELARRDLQSRPGDRRSRALHDACARAATPRSPTSIARSAAKDEAEGRLERARRSLDLARNQLGYADLKADADGVITATLGRARPGRRDRPGGGAARPSRREGSRGRAARDLARRGAQVQRDGPAVVGSRAQLRGAPARAVAAGRSRDPHLCGALHHHRTPTTPSRSA